MVSKYTKSHIDLSSRITTRTYKSPNQSRPPATAPRERGSHGEKLRGDLDSSFASFQADRPKDDRLEQPEGAFLEVELRRGSSVEKLDRKKDGVVACAVNLELSETRKVGLFVPDDALPVLQNILDEYTSGPLLEVTGNPPNKGFVEPIDEIRQARLETFWTDDLDALPKTAAEIIWWQVWCVRSGEAQLEDMADALGARLAEADQRLYFPEFAVIPVLADRATMELLLFSRFSIVELRRGTDNPTFFVDDLDRDEQLDWTDELANRVIWPAGDTPAVCLLDTGVNRAHSLIEPALSPESQSAVNTEWGVDDSGNGHGTQMAGLALYGDLVSHLASTDERRLGHRLESVKILPPRGFPETLERFYGAVTKAAVALPEVSAPNRSRVYCLSITNDGRSGEQPTTWSAAIDEEAAGVSLDDERAPRRLFVISAGNAPAPFRVSEIEAAEILPIEDPAQSWNAITVGGFTDKINITEPDLADHEPMSHAGELSPHTRTSVLWRRGRTPFKPDIVMEAGNRAVNLTGTDACTPDSLSVLTTGASVGQEPLRAFSATSAAAAQAGRLAARLMAEHPEYWPETVRALIIHGAEWTAPMRTQLANAGNKTSAAVLLRHFGYGVPNFERCNASANNHLALVSQSHIQPFRTRPSRGFKDCHFYALPWPREILEQLGDEEIKLKITLSYFIDPNPGSSSSIDPYRYQSYGLRFDLKRRNETLQNFVKRMNLNERVDASDRPRQVTDSDQWMFGPDSISAGSLHCDEWTGPAVHLLSRNQLCIKPVTGWWRNRADQKICNQESRYALVISLKSSNVDVDLHTPISTIVTNEVGIETPFEVRVQGV